MAVTSSLSAESALITIQLAVHSSLIGVYNNAQGPTGVDYGDYPCETMVREFQDSDKGRGVMTSDGTVIGHVQAVAGDIAHVTPESDLDGAIRQKLGWTAEEQDVYELPHKSVKEIDDRGIHLE